MSSSHDAATQSISAEPVQEGTRLVEEMGVLETIPREQADLTGLSRASVQCHVGVMFLAGNERQSVLWRGLLSWSCNRSGLVLCLCAVVLQQSCMDDCTQVPNIHVQKQGLQCHYGSKGAKSCCSNILYCMRSTACCSMYCQLIMRPKQLHTHMPVQAHV